jgi:hypothetical protein
MITGTLRWIPVLVVEVMVDVAGVVVATPGRAPGTVAPAATVVDGCAPTGTPGCIGVPLTTVVDGCAPTGTPGCMGMPLTTVVDGCAPTGTPGCIGVPLTTVVDGCAPTGTPGCIGVPLTTVVDGCAPTGTPGCIGVPLTTVVDGCAPTGTPGCMGIEPCAAPYTGCPTATVAPGGGAGIEPCAAPYTAVPATAPPEETTGCAWTGCDSSAWIVQAPTPNATAMGRRKRGFMKDLLVRARVERHPTAQDSHEQAQTIRQSR